MSRIAQFVKHDVVEGSIPENTGVDSMAGEEVWWRKVERERYFPGGIEVL